MSKERDEVLKRTTAELNAIFTDKSLSKQDRGEIGEMAITRLAVYWASRFKEHLWQSSFIYPQGPIYAVTGSIEEEPVTEIDLLIVTPYRIFAIEIKTVFGKMKIYPNSEIEIITKGDFTGDYEKKNYFQQNEMHARHLYHHVAKLLPNGNPDYIVPLVVVAGNMQYRDERPVDLAERYPITTASKLYSTLTELNQPLDYLLNINEIKKVLSSIRVHDKQRLLNSQTFK